MSATPVATTRPGPHEAFDPTPGPISRVKRGRVHVFESELWLPRPRSEVFPFFADAFNLEKITPDLLRFRVVTEPPIEMKVGAIIDYKLKIRFVPARWRTRIAVWEPPHRFVDEQLRGPYRQWIHEHTFVDHDGGTLTRDRVEYAVPGGALVNSLVVRRDVEKIFEHRRKTLLELFG